MINHPKFSGLNSTFILLQFWRSEIQWDSISLDQPQTVERARFLLEVLGENPFPCFFQLMRPFPLGKLTWLVSTFLTFKVWNVGLSLFRVAISLVLPSGFLFFKDPGDYTEPNCYSVQFSSVIQSCPTLCDPMDCSMPGLPAHHQFPELPGLSPIFRSDD